MDPKHIVINGLHCIKYSMFSIASCLSLARMVERMREMEKL